MFHDPGGNCDSGCGTHPETDWRETCQPLMGKAGRRPVWSNFHLWAGGSFFLGGKGENIFERATELLGLGGERCRTSPVRQAEPWHHFNRQICVARHGFFSERPQRQNIRQPLALGRWRASCRRALSTSQIHFAEKSSLSYQFHYG